MRVLDVGCGRRQDYIDYGDAHVTGLDLSEEELRLNKRVNERLIGDAETYPLRSGAYDSVVCWWVLEHVRRPHVALANMAQAVAPGGEVIIAVPNLLSIKGLVAKFTPLWAHRMIRRLLYGSSGNPFRTYLCWSIRPSALERKMREFGFEIVRSEKYESVPMSDLWKKYHLSFLSRWPSEYLLIARLPEASGSGERRADLVARTG